MVHTKSGNTMRIAGDQLMPDSMHLTLRGDGQWNALPCLLSQTTALSEAMADYYDHATVGDIVKGKKHFAYFSADKRWVGNLTALTPGEGYLFRRMGHGSVTVHFYNKSVSPSGLPAKRSDNANATAFSNANAATNMTMIATISYRESGLTGKAGQTLRVFIGSELVGVAEPIANANANADTNALYFLTIQSDKAGEPLRFETEDGETLVPSYMSPSYIPDSHSGSLESPVVLTPNAYVGPYKLIENDHVVIIRNNEKYDVTGKKL
jgi:hypothetical protein